MTLGRYIDLGTEVGMSNRHLNWNTLAASVLRLFLLLLLSSAQLARSQSIDAFFKETFEQNRATGSGNPIKRISP